MDIRRSRLLKTKHLIQLGAALALAALVLTACTKSATNSNNANNSNSTSNSNTPANKNSSTAATTGDYSTPTAAFQSFYAAVKGNDLDGIKRSISKSAMASLEKDAAKDNKTVDEALKEVVKDAPSSRPEIRNEKIEGDKATIEFKDDKMNTWSPVSFVKEDGQWKIAITD